MGYKTEKEQLESQEQSLFLLDKLMTKEHSDIKDLLDSLPGIFHTNKIENAELVHLNKNAENWIDMLTEEVREEGVALFEKIIHPDTLKYTTPRFIEFGQTAGEHEICSGFQGIWNPKLGEFKMFLTFLKKYKGTDLLLCVSNPIKNAGEISEKLEKVIGEEAFVRKYFKKFKQLTPREVQILTLISGGETNKMIADRLFISTATVKQHRKNIKRKLEVRNIVEMVRYAQAFDLI